MGVYIKGLEQKKDNKWDVDLNELRFREKKNLNAFLTLSEKYDKKGEFFADFIYSYIRGKDMFKVPGVSLSDFWFLPPKTGETSQDFTNIVNFVQEYSLLIENKLNADIKLDDPQIETKKAKIQDLKNDIYAACTEPRATHIVSIASENNSPEDIIDTLNFSKSSAEMSKLRLLINYSDALVTHETRKKPHWWEFKKKAAIRRENRAIKDFEKYLKSCGIKEEVINQTKDTLLISNDKNFLKDKVCVHDRVNIFNHAFSKAQSLSELEKTNRVKKNDRDEIILTSLMGFYKEMKEAHANEKRDSRNEYEKPKYKEEERLIKNFVDSVHNTFNISKRLINEQINKINNNESFLGKEKQIGNFMEPLYSNGFSNTTFTNALEVGLEETFESLRNNPKYMKELEIELDNSNISLSFDDEEPSTKNTKKKPIIKGAKLSKSEMKKHVEKLKKANESKFDDIQPIKIGNDEMSDFSEEKSEGYYSISSDENSLEGEEIEKNL